MYMEASVMCRAKAHVFVDIKLCGACGRYYIVCSSLHGRYTRYVLHCAQLDVDLARIRLVTCGKVPTN
jgi:hypothetical protein